MLSIFSYASWPSVCLLWRNVCSGLPLILALGCLSFDLELTSHLYFWRLILYQLFGLQIFSPIPRVSFHLIYGFLSLVAQMLKRLPAVWETWVQSLGQEGSLEKEMATHSSILAWRIPWMEEPGGLQSTGSQRIGHNRTTSL